MKHRLPKGKTSEKLTSSKKENESMELFPLLPQDQSPLSAPNSPAVNPEPSPATLSVEPINPFQSEHDPSTPSVPPGAEPSPALLDKGEDKKETETITTTGTTTMETLTDTVAATQTMTSPDNGNNSGVSTVTEEELPEAAELLIQTKGLVKQYGARRVVNGVDITVRAGEVVGLLGRNGAGKTTTFYMIVGLVTPTEGHVFMGEEDVTRMPMYRRARRGIGYLPQEESIFRKLTVEENLLAILETLPITQAEREQRCDELLKDFGLEHVRQNVSITLSGGEKRRVSIARALVTSPSLLMLDEPFSGVDPMAVHDIQQIILTLRERGLGVLITDHSVRETLSVVDRAYIIDEGRVLSEGTSEFLINDPVSREMYLGPRFSM